MGLIDFLIVGGGHAGFSAAASLRRAGAEGEVLIVSAEEEFPYIRYLLSKEYLRGERKRERIYLRPAKFYEDRKIQVRTGTKAVGLDTNKRTVTLDTGEELRFRKLLLATGASLRRLPVPGVDLAGVYYLRTLADSDALRGEAAEGKRAVIVGGGFIGVEVAASLVQQGLEVTLIGSAKTVWANLFGEDMGRFFHERLEEHGVTVLTSGRAERIEGDGRAERVVTRQGHVVPCDFVLLGVGVAPETGLAETAGLEVDNGILTNEFLETSEPGIFAAGDNARFISRLFDTRLRIEHWDVAAAQGATAASNMLGSMKPHNEVPYFFSGVFDIWLEYLGHAPNWDKLTVRQFEQEKLTALYTEGDRVKGALLVNNSKELDVCRQLIATQTTVQDYMLLEDPEVGLEQHLGP